MTKSAPSSYRAGTLVYTKRSLAALCLWLLWGDFCFILMECVVPSIMPLKFKGLGASNAVISLFITTLPGLIDTVMSPIIGFKSDRYRSRWGRRLPFIVATLPLLVLCLVGLGYGEQLASWTRANTGNLLDQYSADTVAVATLGVLMIFFTFFNTFVNSVFWYLFNDVVPELWLARFMSWFRMVSLGAAAIYNLFIFKHAETHASEILLGAGLLYCLGFGMMCLKVKEGSYPPPPPFEGGETGPLAAIRTYARECLSFRHYWYVFLATIGKHLNFVASVFTVFLYQSLGLNLEQIGQLAFGFSIGGAIAIPISGWLADRYHPVRIVLCGVVLRLVMIPFEMVWLFWNPEPNVAFAILLGVQTLIFAPIAAMVSVIDPPLFMRIFPRSRYGQFCSANATMRAIAGIGAGVLLGFLLDAAGAHWGQATAYRCLPFWNLGCYLLMLFALIGLYRSWKRYGGDENYVAPVPTQADPIDRGRETRQESTEVSKCG